MEIYIHLNAELQRIARRDKKAILSEQCKEREEDNRMGKTRDLFKKIRDTKGTFHVSSVQFSCSVVSDSLQPYGPHHARLSCPSSSLRDCSNSRPSNWWFHPTISSSVVPFSSCLNLSQYQGLFRGVSSSHQVAKILEFQLQHQSFQWIFRMDFLLHGLVWSPYSPSDSQESSPTPQFKHQCFGTQLF